jgi:hypothetical protein
MNPSDVTRRDAALLRFREKKASRSFTKKIRYTSRKQLAEARPRSKGQFVSVDKTAAVPEAEAAAAHNESGAALLALALAGGGAGEVLRGKRARGADEGEE